VSAITARLPTSWVWLLGLYTVSSFIEVMFWGQMGAFTPLYLPHLGIASADIRVWTGIIAGVAAGVGIPFLPLWGALADHYARQPIIVRSFVVHLVAGVLAILAGNVWIFLLAICVTVYALPAF
jgi:MFS family permease